VQAAGHSLDSLLPERFDNPANDAPLCILVNQKTR
jgi:hypothetical protein